MSIYFQKLRGVMSISLIWAQSTSSGRMTLAQQFSAGIVEPEDLVREADG